MPAPEGNPTTDEKTTNPSMTSLLSEHWELARKLRSMQNVFHPDRCKGVWQCYEVCPVGCWTPDYPRQKVIFHDPQKCIACGACVLQCPEKAIELR
jgi:NAD-dependent dihydropyrimidine dehydrogenase PreA subunit